MISEIINHPLLYTCKISEAVLEKYSHVISVCPRTNHLQFEYRDLVQARINLLKLNKGVEDWGNVVEQPSYFFSRLPIIEPKHILLFQDPVELLMYEQKGIVDPLTLCIGLPYFFDESFVQDIIYQFQNPAISTFSSNDIMGSLFDIKVYLGLKNRNDGFFISPGYGEIDVIRKRDGKKRTYPLEKITVKKIREDFSLRHPMKTNKPRKPLVTFKEALWKK
ncbi:MAG: hypothetical protein AAGA43_15775 [Bacteroidota bacterium]